jgi:kynurenine formamidase
VGGHDTDEDADPVVELLGVRVRLVDLSWPLEPTPSEPSPPRLRRQTHAEGAELWQALFGIPADALPTNLGFAGEFFDALSTHAGTHVDAPWHYGPRSAEAAARTIDRVPLGWFVGPAVVLDFTHAPDGHAIALEEVDAALAAIPHTIAPGDVVLLRTGAARHWGTETFFAAGSGLDRAATLGLIDRGVHLIGTDAWSLDRPYPRIGAEWAERRDPTRLWPAHFAGTERPYCQIEKLARLDALPPTGATVLCLPIKVAGGSGAWARAVALVPEAAGA